MRALSGLCIICMVIAVAGCDQAPDALVNTSIQLDSLALVNTLNDSIVKQGRRDTLALSQVKINGLEAWSALADFENHEKPDSLNKQEWGCGSPFDFLDKTVSYKYITAYYCNNRQYISNGHNVLINAFLMKGNRLQILSKNKTLDEHSTEADFAALFPESYLLGKYKKPYVLEKTAEKAFSTEPITIRRFNVPMKSSFDDEWIFYFKEGRLYRVDLYWLLC